MFLDSLFNTRKTAVLKKVLDFSAENHRVISNNIANAETPGFTAKKLVFNNELSSSIKSGDVDRINAIKTKIIENKNYPYRMDMNNVDLEKELIELEQNRMRYDFAGSLLRNHLQKWKDIFEKVK